MASFNRTPFLGPMFNQNFIQNNFHNNLRMERPHMQPFQRMPNPSFRPYQSPERFIHGNFVNAPRFPNFPDPMFSTGFGGRQPSPANVTPLNANSTVLQHSMPRPRFSGNFEQPFRPWTQRPSFVAPRPYFQNRHRAPLPSHSKSIPSQQPNRRKRKTREFGKLKDDNTEKPFSCDTCDRAFITQSELKEHLSLHIKCDHVNCMFEAHPKIVFLHKKMQHDTGYADAINKLQNDAEIEKWREERRRRFPTTENVKKRQAEQAEKTARGEVLETKEFGKFKKPRTDNENVRNHDNRRRTRGNRNFKNFNERRNPKFQYHPNSRPVINVDLESESDSDSDSHISLNKFVGMSSLTNSANENLNQDEMEVPSSNTNNDGDNTHQLISENEQNLSKTNPDESVVLLETPHDDNLSNAAEQTILLSDDTFEDDTLQEHSESPIVPVSVTTIKDDSLQKQSESPIVPVSVTTIEDDSLQKQSESPIVPVSVTTIEEFDDEAPTSLPISKSTENEISVPEESFSSTKEPMNGCSTDTNSRNRNQSRKEDSSNRHQRHQHNHFDRKQDPAFGVRKSTLLEKLLADDIRHERNVILQCVRHIVINNFFGIGGNK